MDFISTSCQDRLPYLAASSKEAASLKTAGTKSSRQRPSFLKSAFIFGLLALSGVSAQTLTPKIEPTGVGTTSYSPEMEAAIKAISQAAFNGVVRSEFIGQTYGFGDQYPGLEIDPRDAASMDIRDEHRRRTNKLRAASAEAHPFVDTDVLLTESATETTEWRMSLIKNAKKSIEISGNFAGGQVFIDTMSEIDRSMAKEPELQTHLILSEDYLLKDDQNKLSELKAKYKKRFNYIIGKRHAVARQLTSSENHVKLTVVDGHTFIVGGTGITDTLTTSGDQRLEHTPSTWDVVGGMWSGASKVAHLLVPSASRDSDIIGQGQHAITARAEFFKLERRIRELSGEKDAPSRIFPIKGSIGKQPKLESHPRFAKGCKVKLLACGPEQVQNPCAAEIERLAAKASSLTLAHAYHNYQPQLAEILEERASAGMPLTIVGNGFIDDSPNNMVSVASMQRIIRGPAVETYYYNIPVMYHKKMVLAKMEDETCFTTGSYNLGYKSEFRDYDIMAVVCEPKSSQPLFLEFNKTLAGDISRSRREVTEGRHWLVQRAADAIYGSIRMISANTLGRNL